MEELKIDIDSKLFFALYVVLEMRNVSLKRPWIFCSKKSTNPVENERSYTNVSQKISISKQYLFMTGSVSSNFKKPEVKE